MMRKLFLATAVALAATASLAGVGYAEGVASPPATMTNNLKVKFIDQQPSDRLASKLIGTDIQNGSKDTIGSVADIVLDENNKVRSYIVSVGGFLGIGSKYVAVDPSVMQISRDKDDKLTIVIDTDKDQLKAAPEYRYLHDQKNQSKQP